ncbi:hypothetical protein [Rhodobacter sp. SY28-1]|uniref:hypothetical protein n=1 Tax=Rhodobacter sp. SY28-1 TaxID=2562317 RepID=UPI0010C144CC|nr:hypothetical protein [Rhodobacter sp. SY28-1]
MKLACLVLEPIAIVAEDLLAMVEDEMPETRMHVAGTVEMATAILRKNRVDIAFLNISPAALSQTDLIEVLQSMGATVVLMGYESKDIPPDFRFLELPFVSGSVTRELRTALERLLGFGTDPGQR